MSIRLWSEAERPREKLLLHGESALSDAELLAIFLRTGVPGKSAIDLARDVLDAFGGLADVVYADQHSICQTRGLGMAKYVQLRATIEIGRRIVLAKARQLDALTSPDAARQFLTLKLRNLGHEVFVCLFLDTRHRVLAYEEMFRGTLTSASVYPREVVKACLAANAAAVIFAHNHPSGVAEPSETDVDITERLSHALALIDVRVLDHLVIGDEAPVSFAERGLL
jgi:DNA repair protein RadC